MLKEFKEFAIKGNMLDMAVGIIIGGAFGGVVKSLVEDIFMPLIGGLMGNIDFSSKFINLSSTEAASLAEAKEKGLAVIGYGSLITVVINFLIVAWVVFMVVKAFNKMKKKPVEADPTTKDCPFCASSIPIKATRCPLCTSELGGVKTA
ncbi:large conductance mechanosensitive channel protein MscL [candidate division BRC1 bacterium HGW-BRC1-1]|nr:MAG: large conductance mechanosensitive channel protein MscL [candidate division BRC1 bacterium HGW-BRC1-1]